MLATPAHAPPSHIPPDNMVNNPDISKWKRHLIVSRKKKRGTDIVFGDRSRFDFNAYSTTTADVFIPHPVTTKTPTLVGENQPNQRGQRQDDPSTGPLSYQGKDVPTHETRSSNNPHHRKQDGEADENQDQDDEVVLDPPTDPDKLPPAGLYVGMNSPSARIQNHIRFGEEHSMSSYSSSSPWKQSVTSSQFDDKIARRGTHHHHHHDDAQDQGTRKWLIRPQAPNSASSSTSGPLSTWHAAASVARKDKLCRINFTDSHFKIFTTVHQDTFTPFDDDIYLEAASSGVRNNMKSTNEHNILQCDHHLSPASNLSESKTAYVSHALGPKPIEPGSTFRPGAVARCMAYDRHRTTPASPSVVAFTDADEVYYYREPSLYATTTGSTHCQTITAEDHLRNLETYAHIKNLRSRSRVTFGEEPRLSNTKSESQSAHEYHASNDAKTTDPDTRKSRPRANASTGVTVTFGNSLHSPSGDQLYTSNHGNLTSGPPAQPQTTTRESYAPPDFSNLNDPYSSRPTTGVGRPPIQPLPIRPPRHIKSAFRRTAIPQGDPTHFPASNLYNSTTQTSYIHPVAAVLTASHQNIGADDVGEDEAAAAALLRPTFPVLGSKVTLSAVQFGDPDEEDEEDGGIKRGGLGADAVRKRFISTVQGSYVKHEGVERDPLRRMPIHGPPFAVEVDLSAGNGATGGRGGWGLMSTKKSTFADHYHPHRIVPLRRAKGKEAAPRQMMFPIKSTGEGGRTNVRDAEGSVPGDGWATGEYMTTTARTFAMPVVAS
ncbi:hypothetical protein HK102_003424 [Quaeritorhiza haematococci]|nr:hypothetical protein HK102_003424 [Quaeritorhiza haematococci]